MKLDLHAVGLGIEILYRQFGGGDRTGAGIVGVKPRHVGEDTDLDAGLACAAVVINAAAAKATLAANSHYQPPLFGPSALLPIRHVSAASRNLRFLEAAAGSDRISW